MVGRAVSVIGLPLAAVLFQVVLSVLNVPLTYYQY